MTLLAPAPANQDFALATAPAVSLNILVADDVATNQHLLRALLSRDGHRVHMANDGEAALRAADAQRFDLILMDVEMPVLNGLDAARAIRDGGGASATTPIVAVTATVLIDRIAECRAAGMGDYLQKPIDRNALRALLQRHGDSAVRAAFERQAFTSDVDRTLAELRETIGTVPTRELVALSLSHLEQLRGRLGTLANDAANAGAEAHAVTSIAGNIGLVELADASRDVCEKVRTLGGVPAPAWARFDRAVRIGIEKLVAAA